MPEKNAQRTKGPTGAPELSDEAKKMLEGEREVPLPELTDEADKPLAPEQDDAEKLLSEPNAESDEAAREQAPRLESGSQAGDGKKHRLKKFFAGYWRRKKWTLPLTLLIILGILLALPWTRYPILGSFMNNQYAVRVVDSKNGAPVDGATVELDGRTATTDGDGVAKIRAHLGKRALHVTKNYYRGGSSDVFVGLRTKTTPFELRLSATGRQVPLVVVDELSGQPVAGATVRVLDASARTDGQGKAAIVLPAAHASEKAVVTANGYNLRNAEVQITDQVVDANTLSLVPAGRAYFLSNRSGTVDVVSANFDGSNRKTVAAGTGSEDAGTQLFVSPDQKHLALFAKRSGDKNAKLYIVDSATGNTSGIDSSSALFSPVGWASNRFVYQANYQDVRDWQPHQSAFKSYDAATGKLTALDQTDAQGKEGLSVHQTLGTAFILDGTVVYTKIWQTDPYNPLLKDKKDQILSVNADGTNRRMLKELAISPSMQYAYINSVRAKPNLLYFAAANDSGSTYYRYQDGNLSATNTVSYDEVFKNYPNYFISPDGQRTFWSEKRDGRDVLFVGDKNAANETEVTTLDGFAPYGWNGNKYLLVSKGGSQLYILPSSGLPKGKQPLKVSDFYGPGNFR